MIFRTVYPLTVMFHQLTYLNGVPRHFLDGHISDRHFLDGHILDRAVWDTFQTSNRKGLILDRTLFRQSTKMDTF